MEDTPDYPELSWCPDCQSPPKSDSAHLAYCISHMPSQEGDLDRKIESGYVFQSEGGAGTHELVNFIHRDTRENTNA